MEQYVIKGGNPLVGEVTIGGAKNAALGILIGVLCMAILFAIRKFLVVSSDEGEHT